MQVSFLVFEVLVVGLTGLCLRHASRQGRRRVVEFVSGIAFGVVLEIVTIWQLNAYHYGRFLLMIGDVPLAVGMGWGAIIYSAMETARAWRVPTVAQPFVCALLAWNIDLSMDAIAIRMGMWTWAYYGEWFGVPLANFFAWFVVVASFAAATLELRGRLPSLVTALGATTVSLAALYSLNSLYLQYAVPSRQIPVLLGLLVAAVASLWGARRALRVPTGVHAVGTAVPLVFHSYFTAMLLINGYYRKIPALLPVCLGMFALGMALHLAPAWVHKAVSAPANDKAGS